MTGGREEDLYKREEDLRRKEREEREGTDKDQAVLRPWTSCPRNVTMMHCKGAVINIKMLKMCF